MTTRDVIDAGRDVTLLDLADRLLDKGVVLSGDIVLSVAGVDLVYISLRALVASVDTAIGLGVDQGIDFR
ncbi:MAG: gas vesicle protein [Actinomycetota bacterium]|nr:gas vesicle protein [Actinomycetota bacterium]